MKYFLSMLFIMLITLFTYSQNNEITNKANGITNNRCEKAIQLISNKNTCDTFTIDSDTVSLTITNKNGNDNNIYALYGPFDNININSICNTIYNDLNTPLYCNDSNSIFLEFNKNYILLLAVESNGNQGNTSKKTISINNKNNKNIIDCTPIVLGSTLLSFDGYNDNGFNYLEFVTSRETNIDYYSIEHSDNGYDWKEVDRLSPQYLNENIYKSIHKPSIVDNYYRLITYDYDHTKTISEPISVRSTLLDIVNRYNLFGQLVDEYYKGIVILEYSNGTIEKIFQ